MEEDYDSNFGFLLHDVARLMRTAHDRRMSPLNLTRSQWWVLNHLYFHQGINQSELADLLDIEKAALGRLLDRLEAKNWIERRDDAADRRAKRVYLTEGVRPTMRQMRDLARITIDEALASLSEKEQAAMIDMLRRMRNDLSGMNARPAAAVGDD